MRFGVHGNKQLIRRLGFAVGILFLAGDGNVICEKQLGLVHCHLWKDVVVCLPH